MSRVTVPALIVITCLIRSAAAGAEEIDNRVMGLDQCLATALSSHPQIKACEQRVIEARESLAAKKGVKLPQIAFHREGSGFPDISNWNAGLAVTMPIYSGGTARARIGQAQAVLEQRKADIELRRQSLVLAVHSALLATQDAANRVQATRKSIEQAGEALRVAREKYNAGLGSSTEVIDTQVALVQAETNYANALYDGKIAVAQLDYAVGRDPKTTETASPGGLNR
ncbi:MAG: TolC family protein [bacterium]|nr:TolC family protein [bacterium]